MLRLRIRLDSIGLLVRLQSNIAFHLPESCQTVVSHIRFLNRQSLCGGVRPDLVCERHAVGHLVHVLLGVEVIALVKGPAQLWREASECQCG